MFFCCIAFGSSYVERDADEFAFFLTLLQRPVTLKSLQRTTDRELDLVYKQTLQIAIDNGIQAIPTKRSTLSECGQCKSVEAGVGVYKACSRCKKVYYCSVECQKLNWSEHKLSCKK